MRIGITERGDAGWNLEWYDVLKDTGSYDGAILITKYITDAFIEKAVDLYKKGFPLIIHATVTGWGGTFVEPGIHDYHTQLNKACDLCKAGFPIENLVIRVDPIWPTSSGLKRAAEVIEEAKSLGLLQKKKTARLRVSILDEYKHVKERIRRADHEPVYGDKFYPPVFMVEKTAEMLKNENVPFETCAEELLTKKCPELAAVKGCVSETDLALMGLGIKDVNEMYENKQRRSGCHCLSCKSELFNDRKPCPTKCIYCCWK